jgi:excisionase family DNA binding protein
MSVARHEVDPCTVTEAWLTTRAAQQLTGYSRAYLRKLALRRRIPALKAGRDWLLHRESLLEHQTQMQALGEQRHNPWRDDLTEAGRGRAPDA